MTILSVCQQVATVIGLKVPDAVMGSTEREHIELAALANEMAERIAFDTGHDWSILKALGTLTGADVESFAFPENYRRMLKKARMWPSASPFAALTHYPDTDQWLGMQVQAFQPAIGAWTIIGTEFHIAPVLPTGDTVKFYYIRDTIVKSEGGTPKTQFEVDADKFVLSERLLKLGMIWQWKASKGQQYAEDMSNYEDALASLVGADKGSNIITVGVQRFPGVDMAFPGVIVP